eukprot:gene1484-4437_t
MPRSSGGSSGAGAADNPIEVEGASPVRPESPGAV